jgi:hypothetical protein
MPSFILFSYKDIPATDLKKCISADFNFLLFSVVNTQVSEPYVKTEAAITFTYSATGWLPAVRVSK